LGAGDPHERPPENTLCRKDHPDHVQYGQRQAHCFLGWAFKKDTNDTRESAAIYVADHLLDEEAQIVVYDPKVQAEQIYKDLDYLGTRSREDNRRLVKVVDNPYEALAGAHAAAVLTEWDEFKGYDWAKIKKGMKRPSFVFDGRKLLDRKELNKLGFAYYAIGE